MPLTETDMLARMPGQKPHWLLGWRGNLIAFNQDPLGNVEKLRQRYGNIFLFVHGGNPPLNSTLPDVHRTVFALGPQYNQQVLSDTNLFYNSILLGTEGTEFWRLGRGLLNMNGEKHRQQRRLMMPAFQKSRIDGYVPVMVETTRQILQGWQVGQRRDLKAEMRHLTMRIASRAFFGLDVDPQAGGLATEIDEWLRLSGTLGVMFFRYRIPFTPFHRFLQASQKLEEQLRAMIEAKRAAGAEQGDVLSQLIHTCDEDGSRMSEDELIGQANLLFLAGHETTANALTWTLFLLSQHPQVMTRLYDELHGTLCGAEPTANDLPKLTYLEKVIKESMRLLPPVPFLGRTAMANTTLAPYEIPERTEVALSPYITHRMPEIWANAQRFEPERWESCDPTAYEYLPFGAGSRMCIGAGFATVEIKVVLSMILQAFRLELVPNARIDRFVNITLSARHGLPMTLHEQDQAFAKSNTSWRGNVREMVDFPGD